MIHVPGTIPFRGAKLFRTGVQAVTAGAAPKVTWTGATYDTSGFWVGASPTKLIIPAGFPAGLYAELFIQGDWQSGAYRRDISVTKNGAGTIAWQQFPQGTGNVEGLVTCNTGPIPVAANDYFETDLFNGSAATQNFNALGVAAFAIKILG